MNKFRIAIDAMGSDRAPDVEVRGTLNYLREHPDDTIVYLVGREQEIRDALKKYNDGKDYHPRIEIVHAPLVVTTHEKPSEALRQKKESSIAIGLNLHKEGLANAFVSAGHTGAVMAFSIFTIGRIKDVKRPAIGALFPTLTGSNLVLDVGANVDVTPQVMFQFGILGSVFYSILFDVHRPRVGILSIGEEEVKGNQLVIKARSLYERSDLNFVGFVEGHEILGDKADVIVMDGFTGNVLLKFGESVFSTLVRLIKREVKKSPRYMLGAMMMKGAFENVKKHADFEEYGGAPLLGVRGNVIICHGRSTPRAIYNAIDVSRKLYTHRLVNRIEERIEAYRF